MYDSNAQAISDQLKAASTAVFDDATISRILDLVSTTPNSNVVSVDTVTATNNATVTSAAGVDLVFVTGSGTEQTAINAVGDAPAWFFQGAGGVDVVFGTPSSPTGNSSEAVVAGDTLERIVVGTAAADVITIADAKNTQVVAGDGDTVVATGTGRVVVTAAEGGSTVIGNDKTIVEAGGAEADFTISTADGKATIVNAATGVSVELSGVDYVQLDGDDVLVFAENSDEAAVANLYHAAFGRNADAAGLEFWYDRVEDGVSLSAIAQGFLSSTEYGTGTAQTDAQFVASLYTDLLGRDAGTGDADYWTGQLTAGLSRADLLVNFAEIASTNAGEINVVGTVTIIDPIA